jgi:hypothetical protein
MADGLVVQASLQDFQAVRMRGGREQQANLSDLLITN